MLVCSPQHLADDDQLNTAADVDVKTTGTLVIAIQAREAVF
jgi:hypothetical protein